MYSIHTAINCPMTYTVHTHQPDQKINKLYFFFGCPVVLYELYCTYLLIFFHFFGHADPNDYVRIVLKSKTTKYFISKTKSSLWCMAF